MHSALSSGFRVYYKYSACIKICTTDISILCDPWFGNDAYYGTWDRYPCHEITQQFIGKFDAIWISHIHPDHYCPHSISTLFELYGEKTIYIADWKEKKNYLKLKLAADGFTANVQTIDSVKVGSTLLKCIPNDTGSNSDIDSSLIVADLDSRKAVLNFNDCINSPQYAEAINSFLAENRFDLSLFCLGYTGAGPYPQTYYSPVTQSERLEELALRKKRQFFDRYLKAVEMIPSRFRLPFAGKYILSGELSFLNKYRGVADALEVKEIDASAIVLDDSGDSFFDVLGLKPSSQRTQYYPYQNSTVSKDYAWQSWLSIEPDMTILRRLLFQAASRAHQKSECNTDCVWCFHVFSDEVPLSDVAEKPYTHSVLILEVNCNIKSKPFDACLDPDIKSDLFISRKALFSVLTGLCHWNNFEVGSAFFVRRNPDLFSREMQSFLNFCSVC